MTDQYSYWRGALAGKVAPPPHDPQAGFYWKRSHRGGPRVPVAIWKRGGEMVALVGDSSVPAAKIWEWVAKHPVTHDDYTAAIKTGKWPDEVGVPAAPVIGGNLPDDESDLAKVRREIEDYAEQVAAFLSKNDKPAEWTELIANTAGNIRDQAGKLLRSADAAREREKAPHLEAGRDVDKRYKPVIDQADDLVKRLRLHLTAYLDAEKRRREETARKERLRQEDERKKALAEAQAKALEEDKDPALVEVPEALVPRAEAAPVLVGGANGKRVGAKKVATFTINNIDMAFACYRLRPEVGEVLLKLAKAEHKVGVSREFLTVGSEEVAS